MCYLLFLLFGNIIKCLQILKYDEIRNKADDEFKKYPKEYQKEIKEKYEKTPI